MTIDITIANGKTTPSGEKINVPVGEKVILNVTSDIDDEIHAHLGEKGYELVVQAGRPANGSFTIDSPGSFDGSETGTTVTMDAGAYDVIETGPSGYTASFSAGCSGTIALGQTTRAETLEQQRSERAKQLDTYKPGRLEKLFLNADEGRLQRLIAPHNGFYAGYGYTYKPSGAGFALGGGVRHDLFDRRARVVVEAGQSFRNYHMVRGDFSLPRLAHGRL